MFWYLSLNRWWHDRFLAFGGLHVEKVHINYRSYWKHHRKLMQFHGSKVNSSLFQIWKNRKSHRLTVSRTMKVHCVDSEGSGTPDDPADVHGLHLHQPHRRHGSEGGGHAVVHENGHIVSPFEEANGSDIFVVHKGRKIVKKKKRQCVKCEWDLRKAKVITVRKDSLNLLGPIPACATLSCSTYIWFWLERRKCLSSCVMSN